VVDIMHPFFGSFQAFGLAPGFSSMLAEESRGKTPANAGRESGQPSEWPELLEKSAF